jgi:hypothetical protein
MPWLELSLVFLCVAIAWFWLDSLNAREAAVKAAREACESEGLLFLDDTVAIAALKPARSDEGRLTFRRSYDFEFSDTGDNRRKGGIVMVGQRVMLLNLGAPRSATVHTLHAKRE